MNLDKIETGEAMTGRQKSDSTAVFLDAVALLGGPEPAMTLMNLSKADFAQLIGGGSVVTPVTAENVELLTGGSIPKHTLRPDIWADDAAMLDIEGVDASRLCGAELELAAAFEAYRQAFNEAVRDPKVANFRTCVTACDHMLLVAAGK